MVIDTSAIIAILSNESERARFNWAIAGAPVRRVSAATYAEAGIVLTARYGPAGFHQLMLFLIRGGIDIEPLDQRQAELAARAYERYGKGRHPAGLNYGDCFSYALARSRDEELLCKGDDFTKTDIVVHQSVDCLSEEE
jgi:ribonuclease VapC